MDFLTGAHLCLVIVIVTGSHCMTHLAWGRPIDDLTASSEEHLLRSVHHPRVLIVLAWSSTRLRPLHLLLLQHLLVLHLLHLL